MQSGSATKQIAEIAVFDYDGTSVDGQSGMLFTTYLLSHGLMSLPRALHLGWWGIRYKLHLPYRQEEARELVFGALGEMDAPTVTRVMQAFHEEVLGKRYRTKAVEEIARRRKEGCITLLVSATFDVIANAAAEVLGVDAVLATRMERDENGRYTGHVDGPVIAGKNKYSAVASWCNQRYGAAGWDLAYAYGDHHSDEDLLGHARVAYAVCPGTTLRATAKKRGWTILDWDD